MNKKGISLVALVITIIVLVIITSTVIISITQNGVFGNANKAVFRNDLIAYNDLFLQKKLDKKTKLLGNFDDISINARNNATGDVTDIKYWLPNISDKYINKLAIKNGKLLYIGTDPIEIVWATELDMVEEIPNDNPDIQGANAIYCISTNNNAYLALFDGSIEIIGSGSTYAISDNNKPVIVLLLSYFYEQQEENPYKNANYFLAVYNYAYNGVNSDATDEELEEVLEEKRMQFVENNSIDNTIKNIIDAKILDNTVSYFEKCLWMYIYADNETTDVEIDYLMSALDNMHNYFNECGNMIDVKRGVIITDQALFKGSLLSVLCHL